MKVFRCLPLIAALSLVAIAPSPIQAGGAVVVPGEVKAKPGRLVRLTAESDGKIIRWAIGSEDADLIPSESGRYAIFSSPTPGRYLVLAWTCVGGEPTEAARCVVIVEGTPPPGPNPNPGPGPGPAPGPTPPPVPPADPLLDTLKAIYGADSGKDKVKNVKALAGIYREGAKVSRDPQVTTARQLYEALGKAAAIALPGDALPALRDRLGVELRTALPTDPAASLDEPTREKASAMFARLAGLLEMLAP